MMYSRLPITRTSREIEKSSSYRIGSSKKTSREKRKKQFLLHSEHFNLSLGLIDMDVGDPR